MTQDEVCPSARDERERRMQAEMNLRRLHEWAGMASAHFHEYLLTGRIAVLDEQRDIAKADES